MGERRARIRDYGIIIGTMPTGELNAISDVPSVRVGHSTINHDKGGCARTGVTAILPHEENIYQKKVEAAIHIINGYGKAMGIAQVSELGCLETPILLTNTLNIGLASDALIQYTLEQNDDVRSLNPVVAECNDGKLNEIEKRFVKKEHVFEALTSASPGTVAEGNVGGGTGMIAFGYKGGIGTSSRMVQFNNGNYTVGVLVQANFGRREQLILDGVPVGRLLEQSELGESGDGSIVMIVATDAPFDSRQLSRLARRAGIGLARTGSVATHGSGDFVLAFSNTNVTKHGEQNITVKKELIASQGTTMSKFFQAVVEATQEAIYNALFAAEDMIGREGLQIRALPIKEAVNLVSSFRHEVTGI